jgi:hypothetical protein
VNEKMILIAIHLGAGNYLESAEVLRCANLWESMDESWNRTLAECDLKSPEAIRECLARLQSVIELMSRNPRTTIVEARRIYELWERHQINI